MALRLTLKPNERVIVNGCIMKNGPRRQVLEVENRADILRGEEMLDAAAAITPARRIAYYIQIALVSPNHRSEVLPLIETGLNDLGQALPRFLALIGEVETLLADKAYYSAFRTISPIFAYEDQLLGIVTDQPCEASS